MSEYAHNLLRSARDAKDIPRWKVGQDIGVSKETIGRWEEGETIPTPEDVDRFAEMVGDKTLWHRYMLAKYPSYERRYFDAPNLELPVAISKMRYETMDVMAMLDEVHRDALTGHIDNPHLKEKFRRELKEKIAACSTVLQLLD